jgi:hypothetical protein
MIQVRHVQCRRAPGNAKYRTTAAIPDRNPATCQFESEHALIAAPPVENRIAVVNSDNRLWDAWDKLQSNAIAATTI